MLIRQRAYHPEELAKLKHLTVDIQYYLKNQVRNVVDEHTFFVLVTFRAWKCSIVQTELCLQIHPVVSRLIEPIEGTDNAHVSFLVVLVLLLLLCVCVCEYVCVGGVCL